MIFMFKLFLTLILLLCGWEPEANASEMVIVFDALGERRVSLEARSAFLNELNAILPTKMKNTLKKTFVLKAGRAADFRSLDASDCHLGNPVHTNLVRLHGNSSSRTIELNSDLIDAIEQGPDVLVKLCGYHSRYDFAIATLIRVLALFYDDLRYSADEKRWLNQNCRSRERQRRAVCIDLQRRRKLISDREPFLAVSGFSAPDYGQLREIDGVRYNNSSEYFAKALELTLIDHDFGCRRPALVAFLERELDLRRIGHCRVLWEIGQLDGENLSVPRRHLILDISRVERVELLIAEPGEGILERWGHVMFRIVTGGEGQDLVFTFNGDGRGGTRLLSGVSGQVGARLFAFPYNEIQSYYTQRGRAIESLKLALTVEEKNLLLAHLIEMHLYYRGKWNDLLRNCVDHTMKALLASTDAGRISFYNRHVMTPNGLKRKLRKSGVIPSKPE